MGFSEYLSDKLETVDELIRIANWRMYEEKKKIKSNARGCPGRKEERNNKRVD